MNRIFTNMLTAVSGEKWKQLRSKLSPVFTSGKLRLMVPKLDKVGQAMVNHLEKLANKGIHNNMGHISNLYYSFEIKEK